jgi:hypothetical protein
MRIAMLALLSSVAALPVIVPPASSAPDGDDRFHHSETMMRVVERQCAEGTGNDAFCGCQIESLKMYLPPQYASLTPISIEKGRTYQVFDISPDTPRYIQDQLYEATRHCLEEFTDYQRPSAPGDDDRFHHSETVMRVVERQCAEGTGNDAFCGCQIESLKMYLPPKYASLTPISIGKGRTYQVFDISPDTPRYIQDQLYEATRYCLEEFTDHPGP